MPPNPGEEAYKLIIALREAVPVPLLTRLVKLEDAAALEVGERVRVYLEVVRCVDWNVGWGQKDKQNMRSRHFSLVAPDPESVLSLLFRFTHFQPPSAAKSSGKKGFTHTGCSVIRGPTSLKL